MKKEDLPQDPGALSRYTRELCYVKNEQGKYETALSKGWSVKAEALDNAWEGVNLQIREAAESVRKGEKSPIHYFMALRLMDMPVIADYTGFWGFTIKRHLKPDVFKNLSEKTLLKYAKAFEISLQELIDFDGNIEQGV